VSCPSRPVREEFRPHFVAKMAAPSLAPVPETEIGLLYRVKFQRRGA
jgi:hypothetical protein